MGRVEGRPLGLEHRRQGQEWWSASQTCEEIERQTQMWQPVWTVGRSRHARCIDLVLGPSTVAEEQFAELEREKRKKWPGPWVILEHRNSEQESTNRAAL